MYEDNLKNEDDLKKEDNQKNEDHLKNERCRWGKDCTLLSRDRLTRQKLRVMQTGITWGSI